MTERIALIGSGAMAREIIGIYGRERFSVAYVEPRYKTTDTHVSGVEIVTDWESLRLRADHYVLTAGNLDFRKAMQEQVRAQGLEPCSPLIHPSSYVSWAAKLGRGSVIMAFVALGDAIELEEDSMIMHKISIGHDSRIGELSVLCPGVSLGGGTQVGKRCFIGANAATAPGISLGDDSVIAAGAACLSDVPAGGFAIGSPARRIAQSKK